MLKIVQFKAVLIAGSYAAVVTLVLAIVLQKTIGFRAAPEDELSGLDFSMHGEQAYGMLNAD